MPSLPTARRGCAGTSPSRRAIGRSWSRAAGCRTVPRSVSAATCIAFGSCRRGPGFVARRSSGSVARTRTRSSSTSRRPIADRPPPCSRRGSSPSPGRPSIARSGATRPSSGVTPAAVSIRDQRTRWGSASRQGRLAFSWRLILAPPEALETVVIHELAHLRVFGHGPRFWALVASRRPDHKVWRRWLHDHSTELHGALDEPADPSGDRP